MSILNTDIIYRLSGGSANATPLNSLGGVKSSVSVQSTLFDAVSGAESLAGDAEYRCIYVHNAHATLTMTNSVLWIPSNTPNTGTIVEAGLGTSAVSATEQTVANEQTAPAGVTFAPVATKAAGLVIGDLTPGQSKAIWLRRTVSANAPAGSDGLTIRVECETL